jgi:hypothetical protein
MVTQATTSVALTTSVNPSTYMQLVTFSATILPQFSGTPTGTVTFYNTVDGVPSPLGTGTLSVVNGEDVATLSTTGLQDQHPNSVMAVYSGDTNFLTSNAAPLTQTVNPAPVVSLDPLDLLRQPEREHDQQGCSDYVEEHRGCPVEHQPERDLHHRR